MITPNTDKDKSTCALMALSSLLTLITEQHQGHIKSGLDPYQGHTNSKSSILEINLLVSKRYFMKLLKGSLMITTLALLFNKLANAQA